MYSISQQSYRKLNRSDFTVFSGVADRWMLKLLLESIVLFVPCYRKIHIQTLPGERNSILEIIPGSLVRVSITEEIQPPCVAALRMHERKQWSDFWWDNYTGGSNYTLMMDSDTVITGPLNDEILFDHQNRSYFFYTPRYATSSAWRSDRSRRRYL